MSNAASLSAQLVAGPQSGTDTNFPGAVTNIPFNFNPPVKSYNVDTGAKYANINSPAAFVALVDLGPTGAVTQGLTLYVRTVVPMQLRITYQGDVTKYVRYIAGAVIEEVDPTHPIVLLEVQGSGQIEWWAAGNQ